jgi:signal recognition particle subunit SRP72
MGSKLGKKTPKVGGAPSPAASAESSDLAAKKKRKKKRKKRLPKNYNPNVDPDPERWIPRYMRGNVLIAIFFGDFHRFFCEKMAVF